MNPSPLITRFKCAVVLVIFTLLGVGPIPITSVLGLFIVALRPKWFKSLVDTIYKD